MKAMNTEKQTADNVPERTRLSPLLHEPMIHDSTNSLKDTRCRDTTCTDSPSKMSCSVCGEDVRGGWFARMCIGFQMHFLCSAPCALMFFDAEEAPAHDHRARHNFKRARAAIIEAAHATTNEGQSMTTSPYGLDH